MKVFVYVEGPSDVRAMTVLLKEVIDTKAQEGIVIEFIASGKGDAKKNILLKIPKKAVRLLNNYSGAVVIAMPDLYPANKGFSHATKDELISGIIENFEKALPKRAQDDDRFKNRFRVFCFKHDLEALLLAAEDQLKTYLGIGKFKCKWRKPVEDQDLDEPPKKIVEKLFVANHKKYTATIDAPRILGHLSSDGYKDIAGKCSQCFKPFVDFLENLPNIS